MAIQFNTRNLFYSLRGEENTNLSITNQINEHLLVPPNSPPEEINDVSVNLSGCDDLEIFWEGKILLSDRFLFTPIDQPEESS